MSADIIRQIAQSNDAFAQSYTPAPSFAQFPNIKAAMIVSCMDPRANPTDFWSLNGQAVLRNAGGRVTEDVLRSIRVLAGIMSNGRNTVGAVAVVHHTDCGLRNFSNERVRSLLKDRASLDAERAAEVDKMDFGSWSE